MLGAGLKGIEEKLPLMPEATNNIFQMTADELDGRRHQDAAEDLGEAIDLFEKSELMKEVLGEHIHTFYVENKEAEWDEYCMQVTPWELDKYLSII